MSFSNVGKTWPAYIALARKPAWVRGVTLHHTGAPSLTQRPNGLTAQHIENISNYYKDKGWRSGPHFFVDDFNVWGMTPPSVKGTHARSFNGTHIGIEVLGDYDSEPYKSGRGLTAWKNCKRLVDAILLEWGLGWDNVNCHRDDPLTTKTCPGKPTVAWLRGLKLGAEPTTPPLPDFGESFVRISSAFPALKLERKGKDLYANGVRLGKWHYDGEHSYGLSTELSRIV